MADQIEGERVANEFEDVGVGALPAPARRGDGALDDGAVVVAAAASRDVGAVERKFENIKPQRLAQPVGRIIARGEMAGGDAAEQLHQHVELARHDRIEHAKLRAFQHRREILLRRRDPAPQRVELVAPGLIDQDA